MKWNPEPLTQQEEEFLQLNLSDEGRRKKEKTTGQKGRENNPAGNPFIH